MSLYSRPTADDPPQPLSEAELDAAIATNTASMDLYLDELDARLKQPRNRRAAWFITLACGACTGFALVTLSHWAGWFA